jgi:anti-sigma factor RsiW
MNRATELDLMRLLHGELPEDQARALRSRLEREPELAAAWARLERTWNGLELPPAAPAPAGFAQRTLSRARREAGAEGGGLSWSAAPRWVRATAAAALAAGLALGVGAGSWVGRITQTTDEPSSLTEPSSSQYDDPSLAETYWDSLSGTETTP